MTPERIIMAARSWIGTRYQHQGRLKKTDFHKGGCDCLGLLVGVASDLHLSHAGRLLSSFDQTDYGHIPDATRLMQNLSMLLQEIPQRQMQAGDVLLLNIDGNPQHLGMLTHYSGQADMWGIIHSYAPARGVVEHRFDADWIKKIISVFRFRGLSFEGT